MIFDRIAPLPALSPFVKEFWVYENEDKTVQVQKIIPDGFSEIILHYGDSYEVNIGRKWESQSSILFSSQIKRFFHLRNTGTSAMIAVKLYPAAFHELFEIDVSQFTDQVVPLDTILPGEDLNHLSLVQRSVLEFPQRIDFLQQWLLTKVNKTAHHKIRTVVNQIIDQKGMVGIEVLGKMVELSTRQLERSFKKAVGLTPKFYSRIIRFNYIFEVMKNNNDSWIRTALQSGYFDQSHFIKNFKEFTGEEPSSYGFDEINLANFFLRK